MQWFGRTGGYYLFWSGAVYLTVGLTCAFYFKQVPSELIQVIWISTLALPFTYPPLGRYFNLDIVWDRKMFDMFKKKPTNVVPFPTQPEYGGGDGGGYIDPPKKAPVTYYSLGMTSENRLELKIGNSAITMNHDGLRNFMDQLEVFSNQLAEYEGIENNEV